MNRKSWYLGIALLWLVPPLRNSRVRITTKDGEVFLGHSNPGQIIHDLDAIKVH